MPADVLARRDRSVGRHGREGLAAAYVAGDHVKVDVELRQRTMRNHSVTHLMHKALREVLGAHVQQKGSLVDADKTRFDFTHNAPVSAESIAILEAGGLVEARPGNGPDFVSFVYPGSICMVTILSEDRRGFRAQGTVRRCEHVIRHLHRVGLEFDRPLNSADLVPLLGEEQVVEAPPKASGRIAIPRLR